MPITLGFMVALVIGKDERGGVTTPRRCSLLPMKIRQITEHGIYIRLVAVFPNGNISHLDAFPVSISCQTDGYRSSRFRSES